MVLTRLDRVNSCVEEFFVEIVVRRGIAQHELEILFNVLGAQRRGRRRRGVDLLEDLGVEDEGGVIDEGDLAVGEGSTGM